MAASSLQTHALFLYLHLFLSFSSLLEFVLPLHLLCSFLFLRCPSLNFYLVLAHCTSAMLSSQPFILKCLFLFLMWPFSSLFFFLHFLTLIHYGNVFWHSFFPQILQAAYRYKNILMSLQKMCSFLSFLAVHKLFLHETMWS